MNVSDHVILRPLYLAGMESRVPMASRLMASDLARVARTPLISITWVGASLPVVDAAGAVAGAGWDSDIALSQQQSAPAAKLMRLR